MMGSWILPVIRTERYIRLKNFHPIPPKPAGPGARRICFYCKPIWNFL